MAVDASGKVNMSHEFDDDDAPIVFKRSSNSKSNQLHSEVRKSASHNRDGRPYGKTSDMPASNGQSSSSQKGNIVSAAKASGLQPCGGISKPSTSHLKTYQMKSPIANSKSPSLLGDRKQPPSEKKIPIDVKNERHTTSAVQSSVGISKASTPHLKTYQLKSPTAHLKSPSLGIQKEPISEKKIPVDVKEENNSIRHLTKDNYEDSEDELDNTPLSARLKINNGNAKKATPIVIKKSSEDSDDDTPISERILQKKPISEVHKGHQEASGASIKQERPYAPSVKRPLDKIDSLHSSGKKSKPSDPSSSINAKQVSVKPEPKVENDKDNIPLSQRLKKSEINAKQVSVKPEPKVENDKDNTPLSQRLKKSVTLVNKTSSVKKMTNVTKVNKGASPSFKKKAKPENSGSELAYSKSTTLLPSSGDGQKKWTTLVHNGVIFPPLYQPHGVKMLYKGNPVSLTPEQEEVATMFAVMRDTDYMQKEKFKSNFWNDWRKLLGRNHVIQNLRDCDFTPIYDWYQIEKEKKKQISSAEKKALREEKLKQEEKYMWAIVDGVKEKVGNFRVEPPGLFRGRGEHPKMGKLKKRIHPSDITINIGKDAPIPECPFPGQSWKEIRHDNTVTWLAYWIDPVNSKSFKYVFLAASSSWKGQSDKEKYEKARMLKDYIGSIRAVYTKDFTSKDITKQQIAVATYLIDKLALRAGNEKDDDAADTVGCCTLKVENVTAEAPNKLQFNFLGKDSIKYENTVEVELPVYNAILKFQKSKSPGDDLFDKLDTAVLNAHLKELMPGLTAKVFRTFNASITLDDMLNKDTKDGDVAEKVAVYQHANKQVAIICNHQRTVSKYHTAQMSRLNEKIDELRAVLKELKTDLDRARKGKPLKSPDGKQKRNSSPEA